MAGPEPGAFGNDERAILRRLELQVSRRLDGLLHGDHRGLVPGHGTELGETRMYAPGDDVRRIDWNVTARLTDPHIRQTIAERELQTWLVVDHSPRLDFGTVNAEKRELVLSAAAAVGFLTQQDGNRIGAVLAGDNPPRIIPPRGSRKHLMRILHAVATAARPDGSGVTDLVPAITRAEAVDRRRGLLVVISDFMVAPGWLPPLRAAARRHDVLAIQLTDPRDFELPNVGLVVLRDPATGAEREVATNRRSVRDAFAAAATARQDDLVRSLRAARIDHLVLSTDRPWLDDLVRFVAGRRHRLDALAGR
ncbi:MAG: DUF58 domain-containing protein [Acidimicrobiales bacterium]